MKEALAKLKQAAEGGVDTALFFRSRKNTSGDYKDRALGVFMGIFGNVKEVAVYFSIPKDDKGELFDGSKHNYQLKFAADQIPPVKFFWSFTMYKVPQRWLVDNSINRYSIGSATPGLKKDADGSITIYFQAKSPGKDKESNWLPEPPRVCRRLHLLRGWGHDTENQVFAGSPGAGGPDGLRARGPARLTLGDD